MRDPLMLRASFNRPNIAFEGEGGHGWGRRRRAACCAAANVLPCLASAQHTGWLQTMGSLVDQTARQLPQAVSVLRAVPTPMQPQLPTPAFSSTLLAVRYLDLMRGPQGQPLQTPLPDIIAHLEASSRCSSDDGHGGSAACGAAQQQQRRCLCTIIYTHRREDADRVAVALRKRGFACSGGWHAMQGLVVVQAGWLWAQ